MDGKPYFYTTIENQLRDDGTYGLLYDHYYEDPNQTAPALARAQAKYHTICAAAALSGIPYHSAMLVRSDHVVLEDAWWDRREQAQAEPETNEE